MAKGMSLEEFRNNLEGEAQNKVKELENHINLQANSLNAQEMVIRHLKGNIEKKDKQMNSLFNRCRALSGQTMCPYCGLREQCHESMVRYGKTMPTREEVEENLLAKCNDIIKEYESNHPEVVKNARQE